jgi:hypothetical protein
VKLGHFGIEDVQLNLCYWLACTFRRVAAVQDVCTEVRARSPIKKSHGVLVRRNVHTQRHLQLAKLLYRPRVLSRIWVAEEDLAALKRAFSCNAGCNFNFCRIAIGVFGSNQLKVKFFCRDSIRQRANFRNIDIPTQIITLTSWFFDCH